MKKETNHNKVKIIPLGGLEQIGMNMTAFEYEDSIIVVDCGMAFPSDDMLGIDLVIPDVSYLKNNIDKVKGFVITHGHEDHIGALPYVLRDVPAPVYGTKLTIGLIENKLKEHNMMKTVRRKVVKHGQSINLGCFRIEFIKTNHSIADASALAIFSPAGIIVHTGVDIDFYTTRERSLDEVFPWDFIDAGVTKDFLKREWANAQAETVTPNCRMRCSGCGVRKYGGGVCFEERA